MNKRYDVTIIGSGFSGSILAWILAKQGRRVALIDSAAHPRFAIGESSTPIADLLLRRLGQQYGIETLQTLSTYGSWQAECPEVACGLKRGFSYYVHTPGGPFSESDDHDRSLLVAASASDEVGDTHWYRRDVDLFLFRGAIAAGAADFSSHTVLSVVPSEPNQLVLSSGDGELTLASDWIIDASGRACVTGRLLSAPDRTSELRTATHATFAHFRGVRSWSQCLRENGSDLSADPFDGDAAAQHHLLDHSWLWMLRFDNDITSVGYTTTTESPIQPIREIVAQYPSLGEIFKQAECVEPASGTHVSGRLQRFFDPVVSPRIVMLPSAAVTLDPLHSTGIAHALAGVQRLAAIVLSDNDRIQLENLNRYQSTVNGESLFLDRLVSTAYRTMHDFPRFTDACMLYFAGAIACEERFQAGQTPTHLWNADDQAFVAMVNDVCDRLIRGETIELAAAIARWNNAGLADPAARNRYAYTATKC